MDWMQLVIALLGGTTLAGIVEAIRYRKQNMKLKENEAQQSSVNTQSQEIDE